MPELPEADRAATDIKDAALGATIRLVHTNPDDIVFSGTTNEEFASEITGRKLLDVKRYGKHFYFELDGQGKLPLFHFGMTGRIQIKGKQTFQYKEGPKASDSEWPPKYLKFIIHFAHSDQDGTETEIAFCDPRRLGRIRLSFSPDPRQEPPISELGFDPIHCMPTLEDYVPKVRSRSCPVKSLLLDQSFNAGVGNWVADEILYHAHIHPEQRCNTLTDTQIRDMHHQTSHICQTAVSVRADPTLFPSDWLFNHRWGKGKGKKAENALPPLKLPSGESATIKWITVGGRTSAYIAELQHLSSSSSSSSGKGRGKKRRKTENGESEASPPSPSAGGQQGDEHDVGQAVDGTVRRSKRRRTQ